jgi:hypothetical protein
MLRRLFLIACSAPLLLAIMATPALAHGRGSDATNYSSRILTVPDLPGVTWQVYNGDEFIGVENLGDSELTIPGYNEGELYLRIGPEGVFVNENSEAFYINQDRLAQTQAPAGVGQGEPRWVQVSSEPRYAWHDHRIHWMSPDVPPQVRGVTGPTRVFEWTVPFTYGDQPEQIAGELLWVPGPSPWLWLLIALPLVAIPALIGLRTAPSRGTWPGLVRPAAAVLGVVSLLNLTHLVDDLVATPVPLTRSALTAVQTLLFIVIGLFGAFRARQAGQGAFTALAVGSGAIFVGQGLLYFGVLGASQAATVFPDWLTRMIVALSVTQVVPLGFVAFWGNTKTAPVQRADDVAPVRT